MRPLIWCVRRELWENRSITLTPLAAAAVFLLGYVISTRHLTEHLRQWSTLDPALQPAAFAAPYGIAAALILVTSGIAGFFYCLDALHGERRDRSILFWKSLPVSDLATVLSKAAIPLVVQPLLALAIITATQLLVLLTGTAVLVGRGASPVPLWAGWPWFQMPLVMIYCVAVLALWYAPVTAWLLLVSGWARRSTFLWATLPPLALCLLERLAFGTRHLALLLGHRLSPPVQAFAAPVHERHAVVFQLAQLDPIGFLTSPGLWLGLGCAAALLAAAARLRRYRGPI